MLLHFANLSLSIFLPPPHAFMLCDLCFFRFSLFLLCDAISHLCIDLEAEVGEQLLNDMNLMTEGASTNQLI